MAEKKIALNPEELREKYGDRLYTVKIEIEVDDDTTDNREYIFRKPSTASYDRFVKTAANSPSKSSKDFVLDNIIDEQREMLQTDLEEYPALSMSIGDRLFSMLGLSKGTNVKKLWTTGSRT